MRRILCRGEGDGKGNTWCIWYVYYLTSDMYTNRMEFNEKTG